MKTKRKSSGWVSPKVESSTIKFIKWDEGNILTIHFHRNGRKYEYQNISREMFEELRMADSIGMYHAKFIKPYTEIYPYKEI